MLKQFMVFSKAQVSAFIGGIVDYCVMIIVTEIFHVHYMIGIAVGGIIGAVVNFTINKNWTFNSKKHKYSNTLSLQLLKFFITVVNSIVLKSTGTYFLTTFLTIDYKISRIFADLFVSICFNYTLQKQWVFKKSRTEKKLSKKDREYFKNSPSVIFIVLTDIKIRRIFTFFS